MLGRMTALDVISQHFGSFADSSSIFILLLPFTEDKEEMKNGFSDRREQRQRRF